MNNIKDYSKVTRDLINESTNYNDNINILNNDNSIKDVTHVNSINPNQSKP